MRHAIIGSCHVVERLRIAPGWHTIAALELASFQLEAALHRVGSDVVGILSRTLSLRALLGHEHIEVLLLSFHGRLDLGLDGLAFHR